MRLVVWLVTAVAVLGCPARPTQVSELKSLLQARDQKLISYHVRVDSLQGAASAKHEFFYRAPNRSLGTVTEPEPLTLAFDGTRVFKVTPAEKKFEVFELRLLPENAAYFLASTFTPFVPEGFRTPLIPSRGVSVKKVTHPHAADAVEVTVTLEDATVVWVLRWPSGDVLSKRVGATELSVDEEWCDAPLGLCVPKKVTQRSNGVLEATTFMTSIELNPEIPNDFFTLKAPSGFHAEQHELVETADEPAQQKAGASWQQ